ncbi:hypothetical protein [Streptomyces sp. NPDC058045]|uniref:Rv1733c family protein n=1 Tax=Streptomyces sp. NPDC058045 TaxID=3346311 RepID=UPI0036EB1D77
MRRRESGKQRHWRWRSNPLRRPEDVIEAWVVLVVWVVVLVGGIFAGTVTALATTGQLHQQQAQRHEVAAVLQENAPRSLAVTGTNGSQVRADVAWSGPGGVRHTGQAMVPSGHHTGDRVPIWTDAHGKPSAPPLDGTEAALQAALLGSAAAGMSGAVVYGVGRAVRWRLDVRRDQRWDREWREVGPRWSHHTR